MVFSMDMSTPGRSIVTGLIARIYKYIFLLIVKTIIKQLFDVTCFTSLVNVHMAKQMIVLTPPYVQQKHTGLGVKIS
jgi:hypothetical protein